MKTLDRLAIVLMLLGLYFSTIRPAQGKMQKAQDVIVVIFMTAGIYSFALADGSSK